MNHWYANIGLFEQRLKLYELEELCDSIMVKILMRPNIEDMHSLHLKYADYVMWKEDMDCQR